MPTDEPLPERRRKADRRLEDRAIRERWPVPPAMREKIIERLHGIVNAVDTPGKQAPVERDVINACRTLATIDRINLEAETQANALPNLCDIDPNEPDIEPAPAPAPERNGHTPVAPGEPH